MSERTDDQVVADMERALLARPLRKTVRFIDRVIGPRGVHIEVIPGDIYVNETIEEVEDESHGRKPVHEEP